MLITNLYERNNGSEKKVTIKRGCAGAKVRGQAKKNVFFVGKGVFSLDRPFNG
jgi:hypothetical protein